MFNLRHILGSTWAIETQIALLPFCLLMLRHFLMYKICSCRTNLFCT